MEFGEVRVLPGEKFDCLDSGKELLEKFGTLIGENYGLLAGPEHEPREPGLDRRHDEEDDKSSQGTRAQVDQENDQTDHQLDRGEPDHVKLTTSGVYIGNINGDVVD